jgi:thioredoxin reductase (NADPH)
MVKPVIMTVDDDPEVLSAVERDLRRRYQTDYRVLRADSGPQALDAARELKARNHPVALFLVDERMPQMSGIQFLTAARPLFPSARMVLLTAYADSAAAIAGINTVGLDHYLMKPWDPPEQHLYPVLDDLLGTWTAGYHPPFLGIRVVGSRWSPGSHAVKDFLARTQTPYEWLDVDADASARALIEQTGAGRPRLPVVYFPDGDALVQPSQRALAERLGLQTAATRPFYDLIVVGGGPSGLAAAVYGASEGLRTVLVEREAPGGQAGTSAQIDNYLGFPSGLSGADLARRATLQARRFGAEVVTSREVTRVRAEHPYRVVTLDDGTELRCYAALVATGMEVQRLAAPGVEELTGAGVYYGAAVAEAAACRGRDVFIVGGANSAGQAAILFSRYAASVTMLVHGAGLGATMSRYLVDQIESAGNIRVLAHTVIRRVSGIERLESIEVTHDGAGEIRTLPAEALFIFIGATPRSRMVTDLLVTDERGFVVTGPDLPRGARRPATWDHERDPFLLEASVPGIFAAGDVRSGSTKRVAAAVGEGSAAVGMIHRYLETV